MSAAYLIGVDVGGTFTDAVVAPRDGDALSHKAFTVPGDEARGVLAALEIAAAHVGESVSTLLAKTERFVHGSTVAPNALLERRGARTGFVTTEGFRDTLVMRRMLRENMYDLRAEIPSNFLRRELILEAPERVDRDGNVVKALSDAAIESLVERIAELQLEAVGVSFLWSFRYTEHERRLKDAIASALPDVFVAISSEIAPEIRDYERASTTALTAYLGPKVAAYLLDLRTRLRAQGLGCDLQVMRSNGGVATAAEAAAQPVDMLLSGPAGGVVGAMNMAGLGDGRDLVTLDLGGTSCDLSVVRGGEAVSSSFLPRNSRFEGWEVLRPFLDIHALGAGGGSIAWVDGGGGLHVGPRSAGASPGPACYGRGGTEPTVTDADLHLGYLNPEYFLATEFGLDADAAEGALARVADQCGYSALELAAGIFRIVNSAMADGVRVVLADNGQDARQSTLFCFGGAGGVHAPAVMADLQMPRLVIPRFASTFSAFGLLMSDIRHDLVRSFALPLEDIRTSDVESAYEQMHVEAGDWLHRVGSSDPATWAFERSADLRYQGQSHEVRVSLAHARSRSEEIQAGFEDEYRRAYGYLNDVSLIRLINLRLTARGTTLKPVVNGASPTAGGGSAEKGSRDVFFAEAGAFASTSIFDGAAIRPGWERLGPAVIELPSTTILVRPEQHCAMDAHGNFIITGKGGG